MSSTMFPDKSMDAVRTALDGLTLRQRSIGNNIANIDTPGYKAKTVNFESAVRAALRKDGGVQLAVTNASHLARPSQSLAFQTGVRQDGTTRADENNVDIDSELIQMTETGVRYQTLTQMASKKLQLLKTIAMAR